MISRSSHVLIRFVCAAAWLMAVPGALFAQHIRPGDRVTVIKWDAEFKSGSDVVGTSELGQNYEVSKVNGDWLWIANRGGYLKRADVVPYDRAIDHFTAAIRNDPRSSVAYNNRAVTWKARGEYDIAIGDYNEAIRLNPKSAASYNGRGNAWDDKQDYDQAIAGPARTLWGYGKIGRLAPGLICC